MAGLSCLCARDLQLARNQVPRWGLAQSFACGEWHNLITWMPNQRHGLELEALAKHHRQAGEPLERGRLDASSLHRIRCMNSVASTRLQSETCSAHELGAGM